MRETYELKVYDLSALAVEQKHFKEALHLLFNAGVGFSLVGTTGTHAVLNMLKDVRTKVGETFFTAEVENTAISPPEAVYRLDQATWEGSIRALAAQIPSDDIEDRN
jgi:hypothetical protein